MRLKWQAFESRQHSTQNTADEDGGDSKVAEESLTDMPNVRTVMRTQNGVSLRKREAWQWKIVTTLRKVSQQV